MRGAQREVGERVGRGAGGRDAEQVRQRGQVADAGLVVRAGGQDGWGGPAVGQAALSRPFGCQGDHASGGRGTGVALGRKLGLSACRALCHGDETSGRGGQPHFGRGTEWPCKLNTVGII